MSVDLYIMASVLVSGLVSGVGAFFLVLGEDSMDRLVHFLVALSAGAMFGGAFIHVLPRYASVFGMDHLAGLLIALSIAFSYLLEEVLHWHCHHTDHDVKPYSYMVVVGDSIHNVIDGVLIASSYYVSVPAGLAVTLAVMIHKLPKELGDFGVLVNGGFSRLRALEFNLAVNFFALLGAFLVVLMSSVRGVNAVLIPLAVGNFVYVAGSDLLPEIKHKEVRGKVLHTALFLTGIAMMYGVVLLKGFIPL
ncbi:MAG: ZIP family metal transporter [Candidatus Nanohaloarchaea archaeon]